MKRALSAVSLAVLTALVPATTAAPDPADKPTRMTTSETFEYQKFFSEDFNTVTRVQDVELPSGETVTLRLERFTVRRAGALVLEVDQFGVERPMGDNGLRLFKGSIDGNPDSTVFLATSPYFTNGYIDDSKNLYSISSGQAVTQEGAAPNPIVITDVNSLQFEDKAPFPCGSDPAFENYVDLAANMTMEPQNPTAVLREDQCRIVDIAIDTDFEYTDRIFNGNTNASAAYAESLLGAISTIYERDVKTTLVTGYIRVFKNNNDPYNDSGDALNQVVSYWRNKSEIPRTLVHYLTGRRNLSYGGVAYLSSLCDPNQGYGVSAYLNGSFPQPVTDNVGGNWDIVVMAHELGHNHGTGHTHDSYVPTIDGCGNGDCSLSSDGTIMSYCHTCGGGISNIRLGFHPRVRVTMNFYLGNLPNCDILNPNWIADALANDDEAETFSGIEIAIDVIPNDTKGSCSGYNPSIDSYDSSSANGGIIVMESLPGFFRQGLFYTPPADFEGVDTFTYANAWGETATVTVTVTGYRPPDNAAQLVPGVNTDYFSIGSDLTALPDTSALTPDSSETLSIIDVPLSGGTFAGSGLSEQFAAKITGYFIAPLKTNYTFFLDSDDGSRLSIGNIVVIDHDGNHPYSEASGDIPLDEGPHTFTIDYFQNTGDSGLSLSYSALGSIKDLVGPASLMSTPDPEACPVDLNGDGVVDNGDIGTFIGVFLANDLAADFNGDGILDNGDIAAFIAAFLAGC